MSTGSVPVVHCMFSKQSGHVIALRHFHNSSWINRSFNFVIIDFNIIPNFLVYCVEISWCPVVLRSFCSTIHRTCTDDFCNKIK